MSGLRICGRSIRMEFEGSLIDLQGVFDLDLLGVIDFDVRLVIRFDVESFE